MGGPRAPPPRGYPPSSRVPPPSPPPRPPPLLLLLLLPSSPSPPGPESASGTRLAGDLPMRIMILITPLPPTPSPNPHHHGHDHSPFIRHITSHHTTRAPPGPEIRQSPGRHPQHSAPRPLPHPAHIPTVDRQVPVPGRVSDQLIEAGFLLKPASIISKDPRVSLVIALGLTVKLTV